MKKILILALLTLNVFPLYVNAIDTSENYKIDTIKISTKLDKTTFFNRTELKKYNELKTKLDTLAKKGTKGITQKDILEGRISFTNLFFTTYGAKLTELKDVANVKFLIEALNIYLQENTDKLNNLPPSVIVKPVIPVVVTKPRNTSQYAELSTYLLKPLSKYGEGENLASEIKFKQLKLINLDKAKTAITYSNGNLIINDYVKDDLWEMGVNYKKDNKKLLSILSTYRTFDYQRNLYNHYLSIGEQAYSTFASRSEHHLGTAIDFGLGGNANNYPWLDSNAWKYGFIRSFTIECEGITKVKDEVWHFRWIGKENAKKFHEEQLKNPKICALEFLRGVYKK